MFSVVRKENRKKMNSITITPSEALKPPKPSLYDAYNHLMQGNVATARSTMAEFYRNGIENPRARMYEASIEMKNMLNVGIASVASAPESMKQELKFKHNFAMTELMASSHPLVINAKKQLENSFKTIYPNTKTQAFSKFIMRETIIPSLKKVRFLARFFK